VRAFIPRMRDEGFEFVTVSDLIGYSGSLCPKTSSGV
jgi:hypothetical protein